MQRILFMLYEKFLFFKFKRIYYGYKFLYSPEDSPDDFSKPYLKVKRPFKCTCFCLERPEMIISFGENDSIFGKIKQLYTCCDPEFLLYDNHGVKKYFIHGDCCQCGLICNLGSCAKNREVIFNIYKENDRINPIGKIIKKPANSIEFNSNAYSYQVNFPAQATPQDKVLIIVAGLMIDYLFFESFEREESEFEKTQRRNRRIAKIFT